MSRHLDRPITPGQIAVAGGGEDEDVGKETDSRGEDVMREEDGSILQKDRPNSTYELLLKRAVEEGRIGGSSRCRVCGMRYNDAAEADACCEKVLQHNRL
jgi:hypothetical protein